MTKGFSSAGRKAAVRFLVLVLAALAFQGALLLGSGDGELILWGLLTALMPAAAILLPCWAALGGVHPLAAFFPVGGLALLVPLWPQWLGWVCLLLSLVSSVAGQEWKNRRETEGKRRHGGTGRKHKKGS